MNVDTYITALAQFASNHAEGCSILKQALDEAISQSIQGQSGKVVSCSVNSHNFVFAGQMTLEEKIGALRRAYERCQCLVAGEVPEGGDSHRVSFQINHGH